MGKTCCAGDEDLSNDVLLNDEDAKMIQRSTPKRSVKSRKSSRKNKLNKKNTSTSISKDAPPKPKYSPSKTPKYNHGNPNFPEGCELLGKMPGLIHSTKTTLEKLGKFDYAKHLS